MKQGIHITPSPAVDNHWAINTHSLIHLPVCSPLPLMKPHCMLSCSPQETLLYALHPSPLKTPHYMLPHKTLSRYHRNTEAYKTEKKITFI